jgi:hypothetical protein
MSKLDDLAKRADVIGMDLCLVYSYGKIGSYYQHLTYRLYYKETKELLVHSLEDLDEVAAEIDLYEQDVNMGAPTRD